MILSLGDGPSVGQTLYIRVDTLLTNSIVKGNVTYLVAFFNGKFVCFY